MRLRDNPATGIPIRIAVAASAALLSTVLSAFAIARAQAGPSWEVPAAIVSQLAATQVLSLVLAAAAMGLAFTALRSARPPFVSIAALVAQVVVAVVLALLASPDQAAQWRVTNPELSRLAHGAAVPVSILSAVLGAVGILTWNRSAR